MIQRVILTQRCVGGTFQCEKGCFNQKKNLARKKENWYTHAACMHHLQRYKLVVCQPRNVSCRRKCSSTSLVSLTPVKYDTDAQACANAAPLEDCHCCSRWAWPPRRARKIAILQYLCSKGPSHGFKGVQGILGRNTLPIQT